MNRRTWFKAVVAAIGGCASRSSVPVPDTVMSSSLAWAQLPFHVDMNRYGEMRAPVTMERSMEDSPIKFGGVMWCVAEKVKSDE